MSLFSYWLPCYYGGRYHAINIRHIGLRVKQFGKKDSTKFLHNSPSFGCLKHKRFFCVRAVELYCFPKSLTINDLGRPDFHKSLTVNDLGEIALQIRNGQIGNRGAGGPPNLLSINDL